MVHLPLPSIKLSNLLMSKSIPHIIQASRLVFSSRGYFVLGIVSFAVFFTLYAFVLPATYTGGRVGFVSLQFLSLRLGLFAFLFSILLAFILPFAIYAFRKRRGSHGSSTTAGSFLGSILPPLLCCSPFLPSLAAFASGIFPFAFGVSGFAQGFIATYETQIFIAIVIILAYSLHQNSKQVVRAAQGVCEC